MILIKDGLVCDGTQNAPEKLDVLIDDSGRIAKVGHITEPKAPKGSQRPKALQGSQGAQGAKAPKAPEDGWDVIQAQGKVVCPGFIDIHGHSDLEILRDSSMRAKVNQGITTEVGGNCGIGVFPIKDRASVPKALLTDILGPFSDFSWHDYPGYIKEINSPYSLLMLQSHSMLRFHAIKGNPNRPATNQEISVMEALLEQSLEQGCIGLSMGLYYAPCIFASRDELVRLAKVTAGHGGLLCVHHRCEGADIIASLEEIISVAREAGARLEISHLKVIGMKNQHLLPKVISLIENAGIEIGFDQYPYEYGSTSLSSLMPPDFLALGDEGMREALASPRMRKRAKDEMKNPAGWDSITELVGFDNIFLASLPHFPEHQGKSLSEVAAISGKDPYEALFDLIKKETGTALMVDITQTIESLRTIFNHPLGCFGSDALYTGSCGHPRSFSATAHLLNKGFLSEMGANFPFAIHRMTGKTAKRLGLTDRGFISEGLRADIVIFDPEKIRDTATLDNPASPPVGIDEVLIEGKRQLRE